MEAGAIRPPQAISPELLWGALRHLVWVLQVELGSSAEAVCNLNC